MHTVQDLEVSPAAGQKHIPHYTVAAAGEFFLLDSEVTFIRSVCTRTNVIACRNGAARSSRDSRGG